jgi:hypothetical protein
VTAPALTLPGPACPKVTTGVLPGAGTVISPDDGTAVLGICSVTFSGMSPCGAWMTLLTSAVPSKLATPMRLSPHTTCGATVACTESAKLGTGRPTWMTGGVFHSTAATMDCESMTGKPQW